MSVPCKYIRLAVEVVVVMVVEAVVVVVVVVVVALGPTLPSFSPPATAASSPLQHKSTVTIESDPVQIETIEPYLRLLLLLASLAPLALALLLALGVARLVLPPALC